MKSILKLCIESFIILILLQGCENGDVPFPPLAWCTTLSESAFCTYPKEEKIPEGCKEDGSEFDCPFTSIVGYQCTNLEGFNKIQKNHDDQNKEIQRLHNICGSKCGKKSDNEALGE